MIKTDTSYILSGYFCIKEISQDIKELLASTIIVPMLDQWHRIGRSDVNKLAMLE
ncbi:hypothetical protein LGK97_06465 [Clostridium sp. CS001]|uniref:hypothetical protein n=1 Tax=Clostridium sp. CS001 TaxID=2880648 RepID=UPI001CF46F34|nr:hypothetical protein [Clostridium sp. CS001]MCB2289408.1 hypothetical protein [Clostridium sp. CS001]